MNEKIYVLLEEQGDCGLNTRVVGVYSSLENLKNAHKKECKRIEEYYRKTLTPELIKDLNLFYSCHVFDIDSSKEDQNEILIWDERMEWQNE